MSYLRQTPLSELLAPGAVWEPVFNQAEYLDEHAHPGKGDELTDEIADAFEKIKATPETWRLVETGGTIRRFGPTPKFGYVIEFEIYEDPTGSGRRTGGVVDIYHPRQG